MSNSGHHHHLLTVNAGSSSLRLSTYTLTDDAHCVAEARLSPAPAPGPDVLREYVDRHALPEPKLVVHRVVHGGERLRKPGWVDSAVEAEIDRLKALAPLHNGVALQWIHAARETFDEVTQAACYDTGFYADLPAVASNYAVPIEMRKQHGLRRYGFHGLAHQSMLASLRSSGDLDTRRRIISLQLGAGCSITATDHGWPVETSMGFSPLEGLVMATRCGDLDPAAVLYLMDEAGFSPAELGWILNESSGLRGISGQSGDMQVLLDSGTEGAELAIGIFCHRVRHYLGAYLGVLGGADAVLFGGGIGEQAPEIRARILDGFDWAGIGLDRVRNETAPTDGTSSIHTDDSRVEVWVTPTDEEGLMARSAYQLWQNGEQDHEAKSI